MAVELATGPDFFTTARRWLVIFACVHVVVWTLLPTLLYHNAPIDVIEGITWGRQWAFGYDKHPWLAPWLTELASLLGGHAVWSVYLLCQISILICGFATWRLASAIMPIAHATVSVLLLEGLYYYNAASPEFNPNVAMLPLWALSTLAFYRALQTKRLWMWLLLGLYAGLAMMAKYSSAVLLLAQLLFLMWQPTARQSFKHPGPYLALLVFLGVITPHIIWLLQHHFISMQYMLQQAGDRPSMPHWAYHFFYPARFTANHLLVLAPALLAFVPCFGGEKHPLPLSAFNKQFLYWMGAAPFALTVLLSLLTGMKLRNQYGFPLFSLLGLLLVVWVGPRLTAERFVKFLRNVGIVFVLYMLIFTVSVFTSYPRWTHAFRANFPGPEIALRLTEQWHARYHRPLAYVAGSRWLSGNMAVYSPDRPAAYFDWDPTIGFWIDERRLQKEGALFIWDVAEQGAELPAELWVRFPRMIHLPMEKFSSTTLGVAFLPPLS